MIEVSLNDIAPLLGAIGFTTLGIVCALFYTRSKHRHLFEKLNDLRQTVGDLKSKRLDPLSEEVLKLEALNEILLSQLDRTVATIPPRFTAQFGEDLLIYEFFKNSPPGFFVEAGAYDGEFASNTWLLESLGWKGLLVEPHPRMAKLCREKRPNSVVEEVALGAADASGKVEFTCADSPNGGAALSFVDAEPKHVDRCLAEGCELTTISVPFVPLTSLLEPLTESIDFLSLDVEGGEFQVLQGLDLERYRPRMIVVEQHGIAKDDSVRSLLAEYGYQHFATKGCNEIFTSTSVP